MTWTEIQPRPELPSGVRNVPAGTPLTLNYYSTPALQRRQVADILVAVAEGECGVGATVQYYSQDDLYAPGPQGLLFGRRFDLIEYAMSTDDVEPPCDWFTSREMPSAANHWVGTNVSGFKSPEYDAACHAASLALPGEPGYRKPYQQAQSIFATEMPAIPLYYRPESGSSPSGRLPF